MKKKFKQIVSVLIVAVMLIGTAPIIVIDFAPKAKAMDTSSWNVGDIIEFGLYPQSKVTDELIINGIKSVEDNYEWIDYGYYSGTGNEFDGNMKSVEGMMLYKDIPYGGNKYRAVKINQYRPRYTGYIPSADNTLQDDNGYYTGNTYYFKYEPLTWRVLDPSEGYVMCTNIIDSQAYQNFIYYNDSEYYNSIDCANYASDWVTSTLRQWLNNDFYNTAFSETEKSEIGISYLENNSPDNSTYDSADTSDKIFLLSYYDALNSKYGFDSPYSNYDTARQIKSTDYAQSQGCNKSTRTSYYGNSWWWLRSPFNSYGVSGVSSDSFMSCAWYIFASGTDVGVLPALKFNSKSTICNNHKYIQFVTAPTCTEQGYTTYTCSCGDSYIADYVSAKGHTDGEWKITKEPTYTEKGEKTLYCIDCGEVIKTEAISKLNHGQVHSVEVNDISLNYKELKFLAPIIDADECAKYTVTYETSNPKVAAVDDKGNVTAIKRGSGSATITCTVTDEYGYSVQDTCTVKVSLSFGQWLITYILFGWIWY